MSYFMLDLRRRTNWEICLQVLVLGLGLEEFVHLGFRIVEEMVMGFC